MSSAANAHDLTIHDLEQNIADIFNRIRKSDLTLTPEQALKIVTELRTYLAPRHFKTVVQLEEDGRKKRGTASARNWRFETGEVMLYFERETDTVSSSASSSVQGTGAIVKMPAQVPAQHGGVQIAVQHCCDMLANVEKSGRQFIALTWFRDAMLPKLPDTWAKSADERQRVLMAAIEAGAVLVKKIPNPRSPMHPTTTITLNRSTKAVTIPSRFKPVPIRGESASDTLLKDRGNY